VTKHLRIRPFNTKDTYPEQNLDNDLCQAVVAGGVVYIRGQIGQDLDTRENVGAGDLEAETNKAMANIKMLVEEAGGTIEDIVKVTIYLTDIRYRETVYRTMGTWLKGVHPVSTGLTISTLARPEWHVEIDATAVLTEAVLSFLGVGVPAQVPSWGNMMADARNYVAVAFYTILYPGILLAVTVLAINLMGDGLRDALDPRLTNQR
jgi:enamine deaminase RidA (YjgF/YER057c/UK114 family)